MNLRFEQVFTGETKQNGSKLSGSSVSGVLYLGASYLTEKGQALDFSIGVGLTEDSPDFVIRVGIPLGK